VSGGHTGTLSVVKPKPTDELLKRVMRSTWIAVPHEEADASSADVRDLAAHLLVTEARLDEMCHSVVRSHRLIQFLNEIVETLTGEVVNGIKVPDSPAGLDGCGKVADDEPPA
jgi:hypothetical protein